MACAGVNKQNTTVAAFDKPWPLVHLKRFETLGSEQTLKSTNIALVNRRS